LLAPCRLLVTQVVLRAHDPLGENKPVAEVPTRELGEPREQLQPHDDPRAAVVGHARMVEGPAEDDRLVELAREVPLQHAQGAGLLPRPEGDLVLAALKRVVEALGDAEAPVSLPASEEPTEVKRHRVVVAVVEVEMTLQLLQV